MDYLSLLQEKGIGPPTLAIYAFFATFYANPTHWLYNQHPVVVATGIATAAVLILFLLSFIFNDPLMRLLAEDDLASAYIQIKLEQGPDKEFYTEYNADAKAAIDDMDDRTQEAVLAILSGILIAVSVLPIGFYKQGLTGLGVAGLVAVLPLAAISYPFYVRLHSAIDYAVREANSNNED